MRTNWRWLCPVRVTVINWFWINQLINRPELLHLRVTEYASNPSIIFMSHYWKYTRWGLFLGPFEVVFNPLWGYCWKGNFPTNRSVRLSVGWSISWFACHVFLKGLEVSLPPTGDRLLACSVISFWEIPMPANCQICNRIHFNSVKFMQMTNFEKQNCRWYEGGKDKLHK